MGEGAVYLQKTVNPKNAACSGRTLRGIPKKVHISPIVIVSYNRGIVDFLGNSSSLAN